MYFAVYTCGLDVYTGYSILYFSSFVILCVHAQYNVEFEFTCLSGQVRLVALALYCLDSAQPAELPR